MAVRTRSRGAAVTRADGGSGLSRARGLSAREIAALRRLDPAYARRPDSSVARVLVEARQLLVTVAATRQALLEGSLLEAGFEDELEAARDLLDRAEAQWAAARPRRRPDTLASATVVAEALTERAQAALRYFLRDDPEVQARLRAIGKPSGKRRRPEDLVHQLRALAILLAEHAPAVRKAKLSPATLRRAAQQLGAAVGETDQARVEERSAADRAIDLRNRAFWALRAKMDAVRVAGRYVFADDKRALRSFRASTTRVRKKKTKVR